MAKKQDGEDRGLSMHRIEALTDGIFAFAMTMLVLSINVPLSQSALAGMSVTHALLAQADRFINYLMSFLLLAVFWVSHHRVFEHLRFGDWNFVWGNVILLLFVALLPFTTALVNEFPNDRGSDFFFSLNLFAIGAIYYLLWRYASGNRRLVRDSVGEAHIAHISQGMLIVPVVALIAMAVAFIYPLLSPFMYLLIPVLVWRARKK